MNKLLSHLNSIPFSGSNILDALDGQTKVMRYSALHTFNTIDEVLAPYDCAVILYETRPKFGHWVCIYLDRAVQARGLEPVLEFFDPYGGFIDTQLDHIPAEFKRQTFQDFPYLSKLLVESPYTIQWNNKPLQKFNDSVNSCGRHVSLRLVMRDVPIREYQQFLLNKSGGSLNPDNVVSMLTAFI
jgi:hypothetical protein